MEQKSSKPRLVFFQWDHVGLPQFLKLHMQQHVKCLSEFFEVILINKDCDYLQICDLYQPDITLFESGYRTSISRKITIKNARSYPHIPKVGFHNGDAWCECRTGFISDMEHWGIETFFSICTTTAEHTPELAENMFVWPNFIDSDIFHDYGQAKIIPVLFNGYINPLYPWRQKIYKTVSSCYPSLIFPHLGYENHSPIMIHGEQYARTINASWFVPACGTLAKEVVRKHFEIPGSKSCLITERTPSVEAAGFVDMKNCIFVDEHDVLDKLDYLFHNSQELEQIINAGFELVHSRHTLKQRDQIFQWYNLHKGIKSIERIIQTSAFEPLKVVEKSSGLKNLHITCNGLNLVLLRKGDENLWAGNYDEAEAFYLKCLNYIHWMCEPKLKLAICYLFKGKANDAYCLVHETIENNLRDYKAFDPDPVEWAYLIITLLCQGKLNEAIIRTSQFRFLCHPELDRIRWVIKHFQKNTDNFPASGNEPSKPRYSVHQLPELSLVDWVNNLCVMLKACCQFEFAEILSNVIFKKEASGQLKKRLIYKPVLPRISLLFFKIKWLERISSIFENLHVPNPRPSLPPISEAEYIIRLSRWVKMDVARRFIMKHLSHLKRYLHLRQSSNKVSRDNFFQTIQNILQKDEIKTAIIISGPDTSTGREAVLTSTQMYFNGLAVYCINILSSFAGPFQNRPSSQFGTKCYDFAFFSQETLSLELNNFIKKVKRENKITTFDLVIFNWLNIAISEELDELQSARFIILNDINAFENFKYKKKLQSDSRYAMIEQNPLHKGGYVVFKKHNDSYLPV